MTKFQSFHHGGALGVLEKACLSSFSAFGHDVTLYTYDELELPHGVDRADAATVIGKPEMEAFFAQAPGRISQFSNGFRYRMLSALGGWWVDTDVLCLGRDLPATEIVLGWASDEGKPERRVGSSILKFPQGHELPSRAAATWRELWQTADWGVTGPRLVTVLAHDLDMLDLIMPFGTLFRVPWDQVLKFFDPNCQAEAFDILTGCSLLHLANSGLGFLGLARNVLPPVGSPLRPLVVPYLSAAEITAGDVAFSAAIVRAFRGLKAKLDSQRNRPQDLGGDARAAAERRFRL